jgi:hypothetical protein
MRYLQRVLLWCCFGSIDARIEPVLTSARNRASALGAEADVGSGQNCS